MPTGQGVTGVRSLPGGGLRGHDGECDPPELPLPPGYVGVVVPAGGVGAEQVLVVLRGVTGAPFEVPGEDTAFVDAEVCVSGVGATGVAPEAGFIGEHDGDAIR